MAQIKNSIEDEMRRLKGELKDNLNAPEKEKSAKKFEQFQRQLNEIKRLQDLFTSTTQSFDLRATSGKNIR
jgi:hypothetical protein